VEQRAARMLNVAPLSLLDFRSLSSKVSEVIRPRCSDHTMQWFDVQSPIKIFRVSFKCCVPLLIKI